ncbi:MAG TPA: hypothetical protein VF744_21350 [Beijerinckiaceae bacterium]|jgi:hypothetical protein
MYGDSPPLLRLRLCAPGGEDPRPHPKAAHPPSVVAQARHLVETTPYTFRDIGTRTGVNGGTIARWTEKYGWKRPPGAFPGRARPERRHVPVLVGRALAQRLRLQAERLVRDIEAAPAVDPAALAQALDLLERARAEQRVRRGKPRRPPDPPPPGALSAQKPELDPETRARVRETRRKAAHKGWVTRWSNQAEPPRWMRLGRPEEPRPRRREREPEFPCKHLNPVKPDDRPIPWDRRAAALLGWKTRRARMAGREG